MTNPVHCNRGLLRTAAVQDKAPLLSRQHTDLGLNMFLEVVKNRPELSLIQLPAFVIIILVEERPQQLFQAPHHLIRQHNFTLAKRGVGASSKRTCFVGHDSAPNIRQGMEASDM